MTRREKILAAVVLGMLVLFGARTLVGRYQDTVSQRRSQLLTAEEQLRDANFALEQGRAAVEQMEAWQQRSLPVNRDVALSLYRSWLLDTAKSAGLTVGDVSPNERTTASTHYNSIGYNIEARGTLAAVVALLYDFYSSDKLQQITRLELRTATGSTELQIRLGVEALLLPGAAHTDSLPDGESERLKLASLDEYRTSLDGRNLFTGYTPPRPERETVVRREPAPRPAFDEAEHAYFSGAVANSNGWQAWIHVRTTGEMLRLNPGDSVNVGLLEGQIVSVESRSLILETGDKRFRIELGQTLRGGRELAPDREAASTDATEPRET